MAKKKIVFVLSPTGAFNLGYSAGDEADLDEKQADELINAGYARVVEKKASKEKTPAEIQKDADAALVAVREKEQADKETAEKEVLAKNAKVIASETATDKGAAAAEQS